MSSLTTEQLRKLSKGENLSYELGYLAKSINGIACLVMTDGDREIGPCAGNFQHHTDVSELLLSISTTLEAHAECSHIASSAAWMLEKRALEAVKAS
jgi:hypothetical protein